ncbi:glycosyltransferase family 4 protein [Acidomonas methanolica]|uniref:glycosyltransferase family 4 protein n=1 Tax=Acidomonas methanolica TaxID=437 RepID=UPI001C058132|nr:glycosyltransferase family 4 protein [Acidomonas methanolica]MBU2654405.1 glycosyltransferase family 4 protein [Acidomonas methanolica]
MPVRNCSRFRRSDFIKVSFTMKLAFLVQGLFEKSDSIGFDCVYEYKRAVTLFADARSDIRIFAERFDLARHPGIPIEGLEAFHEWCAKNPEGTVIYHYCGAWREMDAFLTNRPTPSVIRWHNNTSPWFYFSKEIYLVHTLEGFENIVAIADKPNLFFWVNSLFTRDQFIALGGQASRSAVVYPASRYLENTFDRRRPEHRFAPDGVINMLFVGRVVQHKGHKSIISVAERVRQETGKPVVVRFAGREDDVKSAIEKHAGNHPDVETVFYGEVSDSELEELYRISDVFLCLSEHEGFGLPVFEAMRCGLPTIVWSTTALRELMVDHPLGFHYYDLNMFAAAVVALQDETVYRTVLAAQERVLESYTEEIVDAQILDALAWLQRGSTTHIQAALPAALRAEPELAHAVMEQMQKGESTPTVVQPAIRDSSYNLFSRYDIETFRKFFDRAERLRFAPFENFKNGGNYRLEAREFRHHNGKLEGDILRFAFGRYPDGHLIFGPYRDFPLGDYTVTFDLSVISRNLKKIVVDVNSRDKGLIIQRAISLANLSTTMPSLRFRCDSTEDEFEFRVKAKQAFDGEIVFRGVLLRQTSSH